MKNKIITLAILREARIDENRTPFSPTQISNLLNKYSNLKITNEKSELIDDTLASGNFTVYKKNILIENHIHKYKATGIWTSEIKVIDKNTLKKVLNFEDNGVSIDDKNIIGETVILKRIE